MPSTEIQLTPHCNSIPDKPDIQINSNSQRTRLTCPYLDEEYCKAQPVGKIGSTFTYFVCNLLFQLKDPQNREPLNITFGRPPKNS